MTKKLLFILFVFCIQSVIGQKVGVIIPINDLTVVSIDSSQLSEKIIMVDATVSGLGRCLDVIFLNIQEPHVDIQVRKVEIQIMSDSVNHKVPLKYMERLGVNNYIVEPRDGFWNPDRIRLMLYLKSKVSLPNIKSVDLTCMEFIHFKMKRELDRLFINTETEMYLK